MPMFHEHPDGHIIVRGASATYIDSRENFASDFGVALDALPAGATERVYVPDVRHALGDGVSVIAGGPMPWSVGDAAIAAIASLLTAQAARQLPPK